MIEQETDLVEDVLGRIDELMSYQRRAFCAHAPHREISLPQLFLLLNLHERGTLTVSALADLLGVTAPSASALIDRMEERGWVERERDAVDRRVVHVTLTNAGHTLLDEMVGMKRDKVRRILSLMSEEDLRHVTGAVEAIHNALQRVANAPDSYRSV